MANKILMPAFIKLRRRNKRNSKGRLNFCSHLCEISGSYHLVRLMNELVSKVYYTEKHISVGHYLKLRLFSLLGHIKSPYNIPKGECIEKRDFELCSNTLKPHDVTFGCVVACRKMRAYVTSI